MGKKALVLSSGGIDSTTCLALAVAELGRANVAAVSIYYGQRHRVELQAAHAVAEFYGIRQFEFDLSSIMRFSNCALLDGSTQEISHSSYGEQIAENGCKVATYVPFHNGLMLSTAASLAQSLFDKDECELYLGAHADDAAGNAYADCSVPFLEHLGQAISIGTYSQVRLSAPFAHFNKAAVVAKGLELGAPYHLTWSCYEGGERPCGECATCRDRAAAFAVIGDSTFMHSGMTGLVNIAYNDSRATVIILDNSITGMTGHQQNPTTGFNLKGDPASKVDLEALCKAVGIKRVRVVDPYDLKQCEEVIKEETAADEASVIISRRPCALLKYVKHNPPFHVDADKCKSCRACMKIGCPALFFQNGKAAVDTTLCVGCGVCKQLCHFDALKSSEEA